MDIPFSSANEIKDICYWTSQGNLPKVIELLEVQKVDINSKDAEGLAGILQSNIHSSIMYLSLLFLSCLF